VSRHGRDFWGIRGDAVAYRRGTRVVNAVAVARHRGSAADSTWTGRSWVRGGRRLAAIVLLALTALPFTAPCSACDLAVLFAPVRGAEVHAAARGAARVAPETTLAAPNLGAALAEDPLIGDLLPAAPMQHASINASMPADSSPDGLTPDRPERIVLLPLRL